jgi:hypothetical protein
MRGLSFYKKLTRDRRKSYTPRKREYNGTMPFLTSAGLIIG